MLCKGKMPMWPISKEGDGGGAGNDGRQQCDFADGKCTDRTSNAQQGQLAMNCDTAINKTMSAAAKQQACTRYLVKENKFQSVSPRCGWQRKRAWRIRKQRQRNWAI